MKINVTHVDHHTPDSVSLHFKKDENLEYLSGQHAKLVFYLQGVKHYRTYSISTSPFVDQDVAITIRSISNGTISNLIKYEAHPGMEFELESISGNFIVEPLPDHSRHLVMFAGGSGITPLFSMIKTILFEEPLSRISLIYSNRTEHTIIFKTELDLLENNFPGRLKIFYVLTRDENIKSDVNVFYKGQLSKLIVRKTIKNLLSEIALPLEIYLCGPFGFIKMIEESISSINLDLPIKKEIFYSPPSEEEFDYSSLLSREILIQWNHEERLVNVASGQSILGAALNASINLPHSCMEGNCGTCRAVLISGEVKMRKNHALTKDDLRHSQILLCQAYPLSPDVIIKSINP